MPRCCSLLCNLHKRKTNINTDARVIEGPKWQYRSHPGHHLRSSRWVWSVYLFLIKVFIQGLIWDVVWWLHNFCSTADIILCNPL